MIGVLVRAVAAERATWWAPALVAAVTGTLIGTCLVQRSSARDPGVLAAARTAGVGPAELASIGGGVAVVVALCAVAVMAVVASAAVGQLARGLACWRIAGASPTLVGALVIAQLALVTTVGGSVGAAVTIAVGPRTAQLLNSSSAAVLGGVPVPVTPGVLALTVLVTVGTALAAGLLPALRAARVPPVRAVAGDEERTPRVGVVRWIGTSIGVVALGAAVLGAYGAPAQTIDSAFTAGLGLGMLVVASAGLGARVLLPRLLAAWTRLVPTRRPAWRLARESAIARARVSGATVVALTCGMVFLSLLSGVIRTLEALDRALGADEPYNYLDTYVLSGVVGIMCAVGGICVLALGAGDRRREVALLRSAGMAPRGIVAMAACEAVALAGTATIIALASTVLGVGTIPRAASGLGLPVRFVLPWAELGVSAGVSALFVMLALLVPAGRALSASTRETLARS